MSLRAGTLALLLGAAVAGAEKPVAPLENTKQELRSLQQDQAAKNTGTATGRLTDGLPRYQGATPGSQPLELPAPANSPRELSKRLDAEKNWLADGVGKLKQGDRAREKAARDLREEAGRDEDTEARDPSDPAYLVKVYGEQKKKTDEAGNSRQAAGSARRDAFAPFLKDWLGTSPSRGKFFDELVGRPETGGNLAAPGYFARGSLGQPAGTGEFTAPTSAPRAAAKGNPYLAAMEERPLSEQSSGREQPSASLNLPAPKLPEIVPAAPSIDISGPYRSPDTKPLFPALSDDKKYFPQQKKF